jgi:hypothetical protein
MNLIRILLATIAIVLVLAGCEQEATTQTSSNTLQAEPEDATSKEFGVYAMHFNAISTNQLPPDVARAYNIVRSKNRAMLNIAVIKDVDGTPGVSVSGDVSATATNLTGQRKNLTLRRIKEGEAIYYIGDVAVANAETLVFNISATPEGETEEFSVRFTRQFFSD